MCLTSRQILLHNNFGQVIHTYVKAEHLYSALHGIQTTSKRSGMDHTVLPAINTMRPCLPLPRKSSPDGTSTD